MYEYNPHGMGSEPVLLNIGPQISSIDPEFAAQQQAARAAAEAGEEDIPHPEPGGFEYEEGHPWWVWGVTGVAILGAIGGGVWWWMKRGESREE